MKRVFLVRHAKASPPEGAMKDHERPLNERGQNAAVHMGKFMNGEGFLPDFALCSTAVRTKETLEILEKQWDRIPLKTYKPLLYSGGKTPYLHSIYTAHASDDSILLVGHNPDIQEVALHLLKSSFPEIRQKINHKYATCGLLVLDFDTQMWDDIQTALPINAVYMTPKSLPDEP
jgi:phosphohistidine phosphatase